MAEGEGKPVQTLGRGNAPPSLAAEELADRMAWFIHMRWAAVAGLVTTITLATFWFGVIEWPAPHYILAAAIALCNVAYILWAGKLAQRPKGEAWFRAHARFTVVQIVLDLTVLLVLIHLSGGVENPFLLYFIFHMVIASILLTEWASYVLAGLSALAVGAMAFLEGTGLLAHHQLHGFISEDLYAQPLYAVGVWFAFSSTMFLAVYMASSIVQRLRRREWQCVLARNELAESNQTLRDVDRAKSRYVLMVAHELRSPLAALRSLLNLVTGGYVSGASPELKDLLVRAERRSQEMQAFIADLLEISRIRASLEGLKREPVALAALVRKACDELRLLADDKKIEISVSEDPECPPVPGDPAHLRLLVSNLLSNAIKYTPEGGKVEVGFRGEDRSATLWVSDNGIGIPEEDLPRVFDEFYRAGNVKARGSRHTGTGLGAAIVKEIVERHRGTVQVASKLGEGTRFTVVLPLGEEGRESGEAASPPAAAEA